MLLENIKKKSSNFYTFVFLCLIPLLSFSWNNLSETKNQTFPKTSDPFCLATCIFVLTVSWSGNLCFNDITNLISDLIFIYKSVCVWGGGRLGLGLTRFKLLFYVQCVK